MRNKINFFVVLLEWYEFSVYNALIPYGIFGGKTHVLQYGFALGALTFLARPLGSIYFSALRNKTSSLKRTLLLMSTSTILMGIYPGVIPKPIWFGICKVLQGFALGGSYGVSYLSVYDKEEGKKIPRTNYRLALVQTGWVYGMLLGQFTVLVFKIFFGNFAVAIDLFKTGNYMSISQLKPSLEFIVFGWRYIFLLSGLAGLILYFSTKNVTTQSTKSNIIADIYSYIRKYPSKFTSIFAVLSLDMIISHGWFTYNEVSMEASQQVLAPNIISNIRRVLLLIHFPIMGYLTDKLNHHLHGYGNKIMLALTCILVMMFSIIRLHVIPWIIVSSITTSMCFGSIMGWGIKAFGRDASSLFGTTCNLTGAIVGGTIPLIYSSIPNPDYLTFALTFLSLIGLTLVS